MINLKVFNNLDLVNMNSIKEKFLVFNVRLLVNLVVDMNLIKFKGV